MHPLMLAGFAVVTIGFVLFVGVLFAHGGWRRSQQLRVIGELVSGKRGPRPRQLLAGGLVLLVTGTCVAFTGVGLMDAARADRCRAHCRAAGHDGSRIGPNSDRDPGDRRTWWVACICEGGAGEPIEVPADSL